LVQQQVIHSKIRQKRGGGKSHNAVLLHGKLPLGGMGDQGTL